MITLTVEEDLKTAKRALFGLELETVEFVLCEQLKDWVISLSLNFKLFLLPSSIVAVV